MLGGTGDGFGPQDLAAGRRPADDGEPWQGVDKVVDVVERGAAGLLLDDDRGEGAVHRGGRGHGLHDRTGALLEPDDVEDVKVGLLVAEEEADRPIRIFVLRGAPGPGEIPVPDRDVDGRGLVDDLEPFPPEVHPGDRADLPVAVKEALALDAVQRHELAPVCRVLARQRGVVFEAGWDERDRHRERVGVALQECLAGVPPDEIVAELHEPAEDAGPLGDREPGLLVDPPSDELGHPGVSVGVRRCHDPGPDAAGAPVPAEHVGELPPGEVRELVEPDQTDLRALPIEAVTLVLHVGERDGGAGREPPLELLFSWCGAKRGVDLGTVVPEAAFGPYLHGGPAEDDGAEPGDVRPLERGEEEAERLSASGRAAVDRNVGIGAEEVGLWAGLRAEAEPTPEGLPGILGVEVAEEILRPLVDKRGGIRHRPSPPSAR